jgi:hypothetical protein
MCTTVSLKRQEAQCIATYSFRGGQITAQALIRLGSTAPYLVAISGGTGQYEGAEGEVHVRPATPANPRGILTFNLEDWQASGLPRFLLDAAPASSGDPALRARRDANPAFWRFYVCQGLVIGFGDALALRIHAAA